MQFLTYELAQEIVERTMKILHQNINVMNDEGIIIGSGDKERINQFHAGALVVLEQGESVEIDDASVGNVEGAKSGINLPIQFNNQIVGVVGITGEPEQIRNYAELVKMAAELVLEQSVLLERVQWRQRLQSEIVNQLISEDVRNEVLLIERAEFLGINLEHPRTAIFITKSDHTAISTQNLIRSIQYEIGKNDLIGATFNDEIVILKAMNESRAEFASFLKRLSKVTGSGVLIGCGDLAKNVQAYKSSYDRAKRATNIGSKLHPKRSFYSYEDYQFEIMLTKNVVNEDLHVFTYYQLLLNQDKKGELVQTLEAYIREGGELNKIAETLFIHRNTLRYRLEKITELTGKDPRHAKDLMELYLAKLVYDTY
ncbi:carbohydrate diacid regulator [Terribacillus aidingensis]|uniref:Carbohydrate diacid regulator n=1 Tax=Terribacillus aidingensis TaxID=586416 RepID=A0A285N138_9BACI|nr:sugar diacid recognition domain-containing protein [Terribacillus aidingensis]SNZ03162.1 carbohydrate diacid regulator [Terribacillus aidingensis]